MYGNGLRVCEEEDGGESRIWARKAKEAPEEVGWRSVGAGWRQGLDDGWAVVVGAIEMPLDFLQRLHASAETLANKARTLKEGWQAWGKGWGRKRGGRCCRGAKCNS
jgi:hypothetical protein